MDTDNDPTISIGRDVGGNVISGDGNTIIQQAARKPFNDRGNFLPFARNALFTGREAALEELAEALAGETNVVITQAITGMGGIGKSQLALEFGHRYADSFVSVHWLNLNDPTQLEAQIAACGRQMGLLDENTKQPDMVAETLRVWARRGPRLLVLDNYEQAADALERLAPLLNLPTLRLLLTARRADFPPELGLRIQALDVFTPPESLEFLKRLAKPKSEHLPDLENLTERLGHLPLALHLAGHYLRTEQIYPAEYLTELDEVLTHESMQAEWFGEIGIKSPTAHEQSLLGTFALSWQKVADEHAQMMFKMAGYLAPNTPIPIWIFAAALKVEEKDRSLKHALRQLEKVGLFTEKDGLPVIHPLLAAYARHLNEESNELLEKLAGELETLSNKLLETGLPTRFAPLRLHLAALAPHAEKARLQDTDALWNNYGYYLWEIADYAGARAIYEHALAIAETIFGREHPNVARDINNLGTVLQGLGDLPAARAAYERALQIDEAAFGEKHPNIAIRINNLGSVLQDLGDLLAARAAFERALAIDEAIFGREHPEVATDVNNLGIVLQGLGDLPAARAAFERSYAIFKRALAIDEAVFGKEHPNVARDLNNLGLVLQDLGDLPAARAAFERALAIDEAAFYIEHPNVAKDINNLGGVLRDLGDLPAACTCYERALAIDEAIFGKEHPNVAIRALNLGGVLQVQGQKEQARVCYERALAIFELCLPVGHPKIENAKGWLKGVEE